MRGTNTNTIPVDIALSSAYGERVFPAVAPGKTVFHTFTTRLGALPGGTAEASASAAYRTGEAEASYLAKSCG